MLEGWKERAALRFLDSLRESRNVPFERVLFAIGIRYVGEVTAKKLARYFRNIDTLASATKEELMSVEDVGDRVADSIIQHFNSTENLQVVMRLREAGLQFEVDEQTVQPASQKLNGMNIIVSGVFSIPRDELKAIIEQNGGKNVSSISKNTTFVLAGEKMGPEKRKKAETLNIPIYSEEDFWKLIKDEEDT